MTVSVLLFAACSSDSPTQPVEKYLKHIKSGEYEKSLSTIYFGEEEVEKEQFTALAEKMKEGFEKQNGIDSFEVISEELSEQVEGELQEAKVKVKVIYGDGEEEELDFPVVKTPKDGWKISFISK